MNIFVLDLDPVKAAEYHCDKHVVKMILESSQLLCGAFHNLCDKALSKADEQFEHIDNCQECRHGFAKHLDIHSKQEYIDHLLDFKASIPYKSTHINHPCSVWTRETIGNMSWLFDLLHSLIVEYKKRYSKDSHKCEMILKFTKDNMNTISNILYESNKFSELSNFAQAMPDEYKDSQDVVKAYRQYYINAKKDIATWKKLENTPEWYKQ